MTETPKFIGPNGKPFTTVTVDGVTVRAKDAWWVVFNPQGDPIKAFASDQATTNDVARAARIAWYGNTPAILALNEGHRIELMSPQRFFKDIAVNLPQN